MNWVTTPHVHYDRVASAWLIKRHIDNDARFFFEAPGQPSNRPKDAIPFSMPGAKLGPHDETGCTFEKIVREYKIQDPAIHLMEKVIAAGVNYVLKGFRPASNDRYGQMGVGFLAFADGMMLLKTDDQERLDASYLVYDSMYALFKANKQRG